MFKYSIISHICLIANPGRVPYRSHIRWPRMSKTRWHIVCQTNPPILFNSLFS